MKIMKYITAGIIFLAFVVAGVVLSLLTVEDSEKIRRENYLLAEHIYDAVHEEIFRPIIVSKVMSSNSLLHSLLLNEENLPEKEVEAALADYLRSLRDEMKYSSAFVISDKTYRYYTPEGIKKVIDPKTSPYDIWYPIFLDSRKAYDLDTDRDEINDYKWTIFVNFRINGPDGRLLGVCGVGVNMSNLQYIFEDFEAMYNVKINLIDPDGLVQVDTQTQEIENTYVAEAILDNADANTFTYNRRGLYRYRMTRYMKDLEWYMVVQGTNNESLSRVHAMLIMFGVCLFFLAFYFVFMRIFAKDYANPTVTDNLEDPLTGLPNRAYLREAYGESGVFNTTRYKSIAVFDIDSFTSASETGDGNELLRNVVNLANDFFAWKGMLLRWGDDDFVALLELSAEDAEAKFLEFCHAVKNSFGVSVSVGISEVNLSDTIKVNYYRAVQKCYLMKEKGGDGVCRG